MLKKLLMVGFGEYLGNDTTKSLATSSISWTLRKHLRNIEIYESLHDTNENSVVNDSFINGIFEETVPFLDQEYDIGIGCYLWNSHHCVDFIKKIREEGYENTVIVGGPEITFQQNLETFKADFFIRGYGELPMLQYYQGYPVEDIQGMYSSNEISNDFAAIDVDILESNILTDPEFLTNSRNKLRYETKRGCFGECSYCQHSGGQNKVIEFPIKRILEEIEVISSCQNINSISIVDPIFNVGSNYLNILEKFIEEDYSGELAIQCRLELISDEFIDVLKLMKTQNITPKVESGIQTTHKNESKVINRVNQLEKCEEVMRKLNKNEIFTKIDLIYGLPNQTVSSFHDSVEYVQNVLRPSQICCWPLLLLKGSELYSKKEELELFVEEEDNRLMKVTSSPSFSIDEYLEMENISKSVHFVEMKKKY